MTTDRAAVLARAEAQLAAAEAVLTPEMLTEWARLVERYNRRHATGLDYASAMDPLRAHPAFLCRESNDSIGSGELLRRVRRIRAAR